MAVHIMGQSAGVYHLIYVSCGVGPLLRYIYNVAVSVLDAYVRALVHNFKFR